MKIDVRSVCTLGLLCVWTACGSSGSAGGRDAGADGDGSVRGTGGRSTGSSGGSWGSGGGIGTSGAGGSIGTGGGSSGGGVSGSAGAMGGTAGVPAQPGSGGAAGMATGSGGTAMGMGGAAMPGTGGNTGAGGSGGSVTVGSAQCSDGQDNDADGKIDAADPDCVSPLDNDESSLSTGIAGDNMDACKQDCFFDGNSGSGDDGCDWNLKCDPANTNPGQCSYDADFRNCRTEQSQKCINSCRKLTPNGCDCFGCCTVPGLSYPIRLTSTCSSATFGDPTKCPMCTQSASCTNDCGRCELCLGKTSIPADCGSTGTGGASGTGGMNGMGGATGTGGNTGGGSGGGSGGSGGPTPDCGPYLPCGPDGLDPAACTGGTICITGCCIPT